MIGAAGFDQTMEGLHRLPQFPWLQTAEAQLAGNPGAEGHRGRGRIQLGLADEQGQRLRLQLAQRVRHGDSASRAVAVRGCAEVTHAMAVQAPQNRLNGVLLRAAGDADAVPPVG